MLKQHMLQQNILRFPEMGGTPKSSIYRWCFPLKTFHLGVPMAMDTTKYPTLHCFSKISTALETNTSIEVNIIIVAISIIPLKWMIWGTPGTPILGNLHRGNTWILQALALRPASSCSLAFCRFFAAMLRAATTLRSEEKIGGTWRWG